MAQESFSDILDRAPSEIDRPKPLPIGTYLTVLQGLPEHGKSAKKGTPFVKFKHKFLGAEEDVDQDQLNEWMQRKDGSTKSLQDTSMDNTYYLTEGSAFRLTDFLHHLGLVDEEGKSENGESIRELLEQTNGRQVKVFVKHRPSEDGQSIFAEIGNTSVAE